jgi:hypothetical protein
MVIYKYGAAVFFADGKKLYKIAIKKTDGVL